MQAHTFETQMATERFLEQRSQSNGTERLPAAPLAVAPAAESRETETAAPPAPSRETPTETAAPPSRSSRTIGVQVWLPLKPEERGMDPAFHLTYFMASEEMVD